MNTLQCYISTTSKNRIHTTICRKKRCEMVQVYSIHDIRGKILCKYCYKKTTKEKLQKLQKLGVIVSQKRKRKDSDTIDTRYNSIDIELRKRIKEETSPVKKYITSCTYCSNYYANVPTIFHKYFSCVYCCDKKQLLYAINKPRINMIQYPFKKASSPRATLLYTQFV